MAGLNMVGEGVDTKIDFADGKMFVGRTQDCTPILEDAKARHGAGAYGTSDFKHAARIPNVIIEKYCNDNNILFQEFCNDPAHIRRLCNDPDNKLFRIWPGRL